MKKAAHYILYEKNSYSNGKDNDSCRLIHLLKEWCGLTNILLGNYSFEYFFNFLLINFNNLLESSC